MAANTATKTVSQASKRPALALGLAGLLASFDVTSVIVALPVIARELGFGPNGHAWVIDAYSLSFTGTLVIAGALADKHGRRKSLLAENIVFVVASIACALQGVGSVFIITGGFSLVASAYPETESRARAFSWLGSSLASPQGGWLCLASAQRSPTHNSQAPLWP